MADGTLKPYDAQVPGLGVLQPQSFAVPIPAPVAPKALCLTCAKEPVVTIPKTEPVHPPTSPATSPQPVPPATPKPGVPTVPTTSVLDQELMKLRQELLQKVTSPSVPVVAPSTQPPPSTMPRPIITPAPALVAPREFLWSQLGVGYVGMEPFTRPMINGGLSGAMSGSQPTFAPGAQSLAVSVASIEAQVGIAQVLEYLAGLQVGGTLGSAGILQGVAARLSLAHTALVAGQYRGALTSVDSALLDLRSAAAAHAVPSAIGNALILAIRDGVRPPIVLCNNDPVFMIKGKGKLAFPGDTDDAPPVEVGVKVEIGADGGTVLLGGEKEGLVIHIKVPMHRQVFGPGKDNADLTFGFIPIDESHIQVQQGNNTWNGCTPGIVFGASAGADNTCDDPDFVQIRKLVAETDTGADGSQDTYDPDAKWVPEVNEHADPYSMSHDQEGAPGKWGFDNPGEILNSKNPARVGSGSPTRTIHEEVMFQTWLVCKSKDCLFGYIEWGFSIDITFDEKGFIAGCDAHYKGKQDFVLAKDGADGNTAGFRQAMTDNATAATALASQEKDPDVKKTELDNAQVSTALANGGICDP